MLTANVRLNQTKVMLVLNTHEVRRVIASNSGNLFISAIAASR